MKSTLGSESKRATRKSTNTSSSNPESEESTEQILNRKTSTEVLDSYIESINSTVVMVPVDDTEKNIMLRDSFSRSRYDPENDLINLQTVDTNGFHETKLNQIQQWFKR